MGLPKIMKSEHGVLSGIKSKLGFADHAGHNEYADYDDYGDEEYADEFGEYGPDYDEEAVPAASRYDSYAPVTTRTARSKSRTSRSESDYPKLVSINDVRAHTSVPDSLRRDPLPARHVSKTSTNTSYRAERTVIDASSPAPLSPAHSAAQKERSEGLSSLFGSDTSVEQSYAGSAQAVSTADQGKVSQTSAVASARGNATKTSFDPYEAYAGSGAVAHTPTRSLSVMQPTSYSEVERVAKILKAGDVVILALQNTPEDLAKRVLDFSFGVSSALDAKVECIAEKVFSITRGAELSKAEHLALRNQGFGIH